jgi:hypothetical protein
MHPESAQAWFERWFLPQYPPEVRAEYHRALERDANPANNPSILAHLTEAAELFVRNAPGLLGVELTFDGAGVARFGRALDRARRDRWAAASAPGDPNGLLFNAVVHGAIFVGECAVRAHGCRWSARHPLWESRVERFAPSAKGPKELGPFSPFQWVLKQLDDREISEGKLADRFRVHVEFATADVAGFPVIAAGPRLPPIEGASYDLLVKYLQRHLPALRDLGPLFPSPADFTAMSYPRLGFEPFFDGRVVAMHGLFSPVDADPHADESTADVYWLTAAGAERVDRVPCAAHPPYFARKTGDALEVTVSFQGKPHTHRIGYRGHG